MSIKYTPAEVRKPLEPGIYAAVVKTANEAFSGKGDQIVELDVLVAGQQTIRDTLYNTEKAAWRITQARHAMGFADEIGTETEFKAADLIGCECAVEVALGEPKPAGKYAGQRFLEIKRYLDPVDTGSEGNAVVDEDNVPF